MFSKAFPMYSQTMQTRYTGARVLYAFHEHTGSHLFPRRILTPVKAKAAKCAFQFWFDDLKEMTVVDECSCGTLSRMLSGRNHKKNIEIHQPYAGSASWLLSCTFLASLFFSDGPIYWTRNWGTSRCMYARAFSWPLSSLHPTRHLSPGWGSRCRLCSVEVDRDILQPPLYLNWEIKSGRICLLQLNHASRLLYDSRCYLCVKKIAFICFTWNARNCSL